MSFEGGMVNTPMVGRDKVLGKRLGGEEIALGLSAGGFIHIIFNALHREMNCATDTKSAHTSCRCVEILPHRTCNGNDTQVASIRNMTSEPVPRTRCQNF